VWNGRDLWCSSSGSSPPPGGGGTRVVFGVTEPKWPSGPKAGVGFRASLSALFSPSASADPRRQARMIIIHGWQRSQAETLRGTFVRFPSAPKY
jgi:hypothetical protein